MIPAPLSVSAAAFSAVALGLTLRLVVRPHRRLRGRVEPYVSPSLARLTYTGGEGALRSIFGPIVREAANRVGDIVDRSGTSATVVRIRQAGWWEGLSDDQMIARYRLRQLALLAGALCVALLTGQLMGANVTIRLLLAVLGVVVGGTRSRGRLQRAIDERRERMRVEIYTINQQLAMRVRAGGGVIHAVSASVARGRGEVVSELAEALRLHRSGWRGADAFRRIAELTPEPFCSRTYRLLAAADERGGDLGQALLSLAEDVRETRRESIKRTATKRRAAMLVPTIAILAPVLILFVAAPLPYLITGWQ